MNQLHLNCSLPRAGSELLQCLLSQHPEIYGSITSPLPMMIAGTHLNAGNREFNGLGFAETKEARNRFCKSGIEGFYNGLTDKPVVVDKSRAWWDKISFIWELYPKAKLLCMLRPEEEIIKSLEKRQQTDPFNPDFGELPLHPEKRAEYWRNRPPLQAALGGLEYLKMHHANDPRIIYIWYSALIENPIDIMNQVFQLLEVEPFQIDPNNVQKTVQELEGAFWPLGDHTVKKEIKK